jgi:hypothetical protein
MFFHIVCVYLHFSVYMFRRCPCYTVNVHSVNIFLDGYICRTGKRSNLLKLNYMLLYLVKDHLAVAVGLAPPTPILVFFTQHAIAFLLLLHF